MVERPLRVAEPPAAGGPPRRVCLRDVAAACGVSLTTASHAMNDVPSARVSPATRRRVREAAARLGYRHGAGDQAPAAPAVRTLGVLSHGLMRAPHAGKVLQGIEDAARRRACAVLLVDTDAHAGAGAPALDPLLSRDLDGVVVVSRFHRTVEVPACLAGREVVVVDGRDADGRLPCVVPDEVQGGRDAVEHLLAAGHRRLGFVTNVDDVPAARGRLLGAGAALGAAGLPWDERAVSADRPDAGGGHRAAGSLLRRPDRPTALVCFNDAMAMGVYRAAAELGLRIPDDLSVVGFDDESRIATGLYPGLTTLALPHYEMGRWGAERLLADGWGDASPEAALLACTLVRRGSVGPPR